MPGTHRAKTNKAAFKNPFPVRISLFVDGEGKIISGRTDRRKRSLWRLYILRKEMAVGA